jgi:hypothetical protein
MTIHFCDDKFRVVGLSAFVGNLARVEIVGKDIRIVGISDDGKDSSSFFGQDVTLSMRLFELI